MITDNSIGRIVLLAAVFLFTLCDGKKNANLENMSGEKISITGTAENGKEGALVLTDKGPYYIDGIDGWADDILGKTIEATGILFHQTDEDLLENEKGEYRAGTVGGRMVLREAQWKIIE